MRRILLLIFKKEKKDEISNGSNTLSLENLEDRTVTGSWPRVSHYSAMGK